MMDILLQIGLAESLFISTLILSQNKKRLYDYLLVCWICVIAIDLVFFLISYGKETTEIPFLLFLNIEAPFILGPLLLLFSSSIISGQQTLTRKDALYFVPFLVFGIILLIHKSVFPFEVRNGFVVTIHDPFGLITINSLLLIMAMVIYPIWSIIRIRKTFLIHENYFSQSSLINLKWLSRFNFAVLAIWLTKALSLVTMSTGLLLFEDRDVISFFAVGNIILVFCTGFINYKMRYEISEHYINMEENRSYLQNFKKGIEGKKYDRTGLDNEKSKEYLQKLAAYMEGQKPYLNNRVTLRNIADDLDISTNHLSQVINQHLEKNFFHFINEYRVNEFIRMMGNPSSSNLSLEGIAYECGFSSRSSFYSTFKKITGFTPSQYHQSYIQSNS